MCRLIKRASMRLENAKSNYEKYLNTLDFVYLEGAAFDLQQTMEFYIKGFIELLGEEYRKGHSFKENVNILTSLYVDDKDLELHFENIEDLAETIANNDNEYTSWETQSRYDDGFFVTKEDIKEAINICDSLSKEINYFIEIE